MEPYFDGYIMLREDQGGGYYNNIGLAKCKLVSGEDKLEIYIGNKLMDFSDIESLKNFGVKFYENLRDFPHYYFMTAEDIWPAEGDNSEL